MGKSTEFIDIKREKPIEHAASERVLNWQEYQQPLNENKVKVQASRCMDCGTPFCQMGTMLNQSTSGCPLYNLIPEWNELVSQGKWYEAFQRLAKTNNFPEFTSKACPAPCEGSCTAGIPSESVTIKSIEKAIIDKAFEEGWVTPRIPKKRTNYSVAVIGSGPAGLAAADELNQLGHSVTVYEREDRFGGLLMYGIPNMKIEKKYVERRVSLLQAEGIRFIANTNIGVHISLEKLKEQYNAVLLCIGAEKPRALQLPGSLLKGVYPAMQYLTNNTKHLLDHSVPLEIDANGKNVIVIGGGDTGADCVATAIRQGCKSVVQFGKYGQLPSEREDNNPWPEDPRTFTLDYAYEEAVEVHGKDPRQYFIQTNSFIGNSKGELTQLSTTSFNQNNEEAITWDADLVFVAIGFEGVSNELFPTVQTNNKRIVANDSDFKTNEQGVFAAGDARRGQSLIVWAIQEGRKAAAGIHTYLKQEHVQLA